MKKIVLIDGHNLLFRMFYGIPSPIKNSKGNDIRGLIGFIGSLKKIVDEFNPYSVVVVFDSETSRNSNLELDQSYKANRVDYTMIADENNPFTQLSLIKKALDYLNIHHIEVIDNEADDYIASLVQNESYDYIVVSTDSDFIQLVNKNVFLYVPRGKNSILYNEEEVIKKYNVIPSNYVLYKALVGDKSDNIKGVRGIGKILASKILTYDSIDEYINNNNSKVSELLINNKELIDKNIKLIQMNKEIDISDCIFNPLSNLINKKTYEIIEAINEK